MNRHRIASVQAVVGATTVAVVLFGASRAEADLAHGVWEGRAVCKDGPMFYRASIEPAQRAGRLVIDLLDSAGGRPWARRIGTISDALREDAKGSVHNTSPQHWAVRPLEQPPVPGMFLLSPDHETLAATAPFGNCSALTLRRVDSRVATGGIGAAEGLAPRYAGTISCSPPQPRAIVQLEIGAASGGSFDGIVRYRGHPMSTGPEGSYSVIGEFQPQSGELTLIADRWLGSTPRGDTPDMRLELRDGGTRLVGLTNAPNCGTVEVFVPGFEPAAGLGTPSPPRPISDWTDASACVALVGWASQALEEAGVESLYTGVTAGQVTQVGIGLLVDERFVPFFGKPFEAVSADERRHLATVSEYCARLTEFATAMFHSGARQLATDFFRLSPPVLSTAAPRVRLLRARLSKEMATLRPQPVDESDIPDLESRLSELDERFADLWKEDLAAARALIQDKLDLARGDMERRLRAEIDDLPSTQAAFLASRSIESSIAHFAEDSERAARLRAALAERLGNIADGLLGTLAKEHDHDTYTLVDVRRLATAVDALWPAIMDHVRANGPGLRSLSAVATRASGSALDEFRSRSDGIMKAAQDFTERERAYGTVVNLYSSHVPNAGALSGAYSRLTAHLESLRPVPRPEDLLDQDGTPSNFGMKLAIADYTSRVWSQVDRLIGINVSRAYAGVRVSAVRKLECTSAQAGGYWCDFDMRWDGPFPFLWLTDLSSYRARFALQGNAWSIVETPPGAPMRASGQQKSGGGFMDMTDPMQFWGANMMMGIR